MIELISTADSVDQAKALLMAGIDTLYIGEEDFGLRLPAFFSPKEISELTNLAHGLNKSICVAVNGLFHNDQIKHVTPYLEVLQSIGVDSITVGDPGVIHLLKSKNMNLPFIYDGQTMVTSAKQINFWAKRGAQGAVLARELTFEELIAIRKLVSVPVELLVYGATCIHHSKRNLVENYYNYIEQPIPSQQRLFLSEPKKKDTHYSIYEDCHGTHIFNTHDVNLMLHLDKLVKAGLTQWKLDGIFTRGNDFVEIAHLFVQAKKAIEENQWSETVMESLNEQLLSYHPRERTLNEGFFLKDPVDVQ